MKTIVKLNGMRMEKLTFILILVMFSFLRLNLYAQIIYTDIQDTILTFPENVPGIQDETNYIYFDLDNEGEHDFYFYAHYWEEWLSPSAPEYPFYVMQLQSINNKGVAWFEGCAIDFAYGDTIQSEFWLDGGLVFLDILGSYAECNLPYQDGYLGIRLTENDNYYYGWVRLDASTDTLVIKDFAYNSSPNETILAGQMETVGIIESSREDEVHIYFDGNNLRFKTGKPDYDTYTVFTIEGKQIVAGKIISENLTPSFHYKPGIYLIMLKNSHSCTIKKILVH